MRPITAFIITALLSSCATLATASTMSLPYEESIVSMDTTITVRRESAQDQTELELDHGGDVCSVFMGDTVRVRVADMLESAAP